MRVEDLSNGCIEEHSSKGSSASGSGAGGERVSNKKTEEHAAC